MHTHCGTFEDLFFICVYVCESGVSSSTSGTQGGQNRGSDLSELNISGYELPNTDAESKT